MFFKQHPHINAVERIVPTNVANIISTNIASTVLVNSDNKKVSYKMDYYILYRFLLVTMLLFIVVIISYHYAKHRSKQEILTYYQYTNGEIK